VPTVLVTGAGRGIGLATTRRLAAAGWTVHAAARSAAHRAELDAIDNVIPLALDITSDADIAALADHLPARLDGLVNNAGIAVHGPIETLSRADVARQLDVNVAAQVAVTQAALPALRAARGRIVFVSSVSGRVATPGTGIYCASKFAVEGLADSLRIELRPWRINVSLVEPGPTRTDMWTGVFDDFDAATAAMSEEHRNLYRRQIRGMRRLLPAMQRSAVDPDRVADRIEHALTARRPRRRYLCDPASRAQVIATGLTPQAVTDRVISTVTRSR
jgi:NAD(P)-dependent dehydrogenase (short-subunit alcohol dehydrogenase family)